MKHTQLLLVLAFLFIKATTMGQCTSPPKLDSLNATFTKCSDFYQAVVQAFHNIPNQDSTKYSIKLFGILDTNRITILYTETDKSKSRFFLNREYIPSEHNAFIYEITAENECGTDTLIGEHTIPNDAIKLAIPDTLCEGFIPSYILGPNELMRCDDQTPLYILKTPMYDSLNTNHFFNLYLKQGGSISYLGNNYNSDSIFLPEIPPVDFQLYATTWDSCSCVNGFGTDNKIIATLNIQVLEDSSCVGINGKVYADRVENCFNEETIVPRGLIKINDNYYSYTDNNGNYYARLPFGTYDVSLATQQGETDCNTNPFNITLDANNPTATQDLHASIDEANMHIALQASRARVGRTNAGRVYLENRYFDQTNRELTLTWPNEVTMGNINPTPTNITGNVVRWSNINMDAFERKYFSFHYTLNQGVDIGDEVRWYATLEGQIDYSDSTVTLVTNSYDPNEVIVNKPEVLDTELNKRLKYTVHFQNTGNDTAYLVRVIDTLDAKLDMATLAVLGASHDFEFDIVSGNVMQWTFNDINLLDSTSNEEKSKGWFQFFVDFKDDVVINDYAESTAHIYFDTNEPIVTNTAVSTITNNVSIQEYGAVTFSLHPNPATSELFVTSNVSISSYQILSIDGRMVKQVQNISNGQAISVQELPRGIYYLKIADTNGQIAVQPFEKM